MQPIKTKFVFRVCLLCTALQVLCYRSIAVGTINAAQWQKLTSDSAFSYRNDKESILQPAKTNNGSFERFLFSISQFLTSGAGRVLLWCIVAASVIFIAYKLLFSKDSILFNRKGQLMKQKTEPVVNEQDVATTNWEQLLQNATLNNDQRLTIRYSYMWLLQLMQKRGLIRFSNDKTNFDYYTELSNSEYRQPFRQLSRQYEYAWYGQYTLSSQQYDDYSALFNTLKTKLA